MGEGLIQHLINARTKKLMLIPRCNFSWKNKGENEEDHPAHKCNIFQNHRTPSHKCKCGCSQLKNKK